MLWEFESALGLRAGTLTFEPSGFHRRRIGAAHRRFLTSPRAPAVPAVRVNIGPHRHDATEASASPPCTCHDEVDLPTFANRLAALE